MNTSELMEIEAIRQMKARYFRLMDSKCWAEWRELFAADATLDTDMEPDDGSGACQRTPTLCGAEQIVSVLSARLQHVVTIHHGHMPEIEILSPTTAKGIWAMEDVLREGTDGRLHGYGHYHETYVKLDSRWHIQTLHLTRLRVDVSGDFGNELKVAAVAGAAQ